MAPNLVVGEYCPLVRPSMVEENHIDVYIPSDCVNEVVSTNCKCLTVSASLPNGKSGISHFDSRGNGGSTSVDTVESVSVHIIWET